MDKIEEVKLRSAGARAREILRELLKEMNNKPLLVHEINGNQWHDRTDATKARIMNAIEELKSFALPAQK
jgi:hypothetical protein